MSRLQELIDVLAETDPVARNPNAKAHHLCKICNQPATFFRSARAEMEYRISAICQSCQDYFFPVEQ